jgi:hypothetical protein
MVQRLERSELVKQGWASAVCWLEIRYAHHDSFTMQSWHSGDGLFLVRLGTGWFGWLVYSYLWALGELQENFQAKISLYPNCYAETFTCLTLFMDPLVIITRSESIHLRYYN